MTNQPFLRNQWIGRFVLRRLEQKKLNFEATWIPAQNVFAFVHHGGGRDVGQVLAAAAGQVCDGLRAVEEPDVDHLPSAQPQPGQVDQDLPVSSAVRHLLVVSFGLVIISKLFLPQRGCSVGRVSFKRSRVMVQLY